MVLRNDKSKSQFSSSLESSTKDSSQVKTVATPTFVETANEGSQSSEFESCKNASPPTATTESIETAREITTTAHYQAKSAKPAGLNFVTQIGAQQQLISAKSISEGSISMLDKEIPSLMSTSVAEASSSNKPDSRSTATQPVVQIPCAAQSTTSLPIPPAGQTQAESTPPGAMKKSGAQLGPICPSKDLPASCPIKCAVCSYEFTARYEGHALGVADLLIMLDSELHRAELEGATYCRCKVCSVLDADRKNKLATRAAVENRKNLVAQIEKFLLQVSK